MSGRDFGGEMRLRLAGGTNLTMRGSFSISPAGHSIEAVTNHDGSVSRNVTLKPRTAEVSLEDDGTDVHQLLRAARQDIYITEEFNRVTHVFLNAFFSGDATIDRATGEWTGLVINGSDYQRVGG